MILKYKFRKGAATKGDGSEAATPTTDPTESAATVALRRLWWPGLRDHRISDPTASAEILSPDTGREPVQVRPVRGRERVRPLRHVQRELLRGLRRHEPQTSEKEEPRAKKNREPRDGHENTATVAAKRGEFVRPAARTAT